MAARGRRLFFDFVIEAPTRFSREVQRAAEQVLPCIGSAVCRPRFQAQEIMSEDDVTAALSRIAKLGSHGVCIKARDLPTIRSAVDQLIAAGIPVITLVTDLTTTKRIAYVGLDNESAGRTAAYLIAKTIGDGDGTVLTSRSNDRFLGEEEREVAFKASLNQLCPNLRVIDASGGSGVHVETSRIMQGVVAGLDQVCAVYSMGGGNTAILNALEQNGSLPDVFVAHDLDHDNRQLINDGRLSYVLHHDLHVDLQNVFQAFLHHHRLLPVSPQIAISHIQVITPENIPPVIRRF
ncbi:LacI family transcriptional regulator [Shimia sagamensis]|uniref:LacI family transcriptional regulator n=1 Tax=Shimia sagamensis TaxID=1566352 RepID=A0ABY1PL52_9RHOB|nr:LacI family transcriptional regulator [Shimia sagamensis]